MDKHNLKSNPTGKVNKDVWTHIDKTLRVWDAFSRTSSTAMWIILIKASSFGEIRCKTVIFHSHVVSYITICLAVGIIEFVGWFLYFDFAFYTRAMVFLDLRVKVVKIISNVMYEMTTFFARIVFIGIQCRLIHVSRRTISTIWQFFFFFFQSNFKISVNEYFKINQLHFLFFLQKLSKKRSKYIRHTIFPTSSYVLLQLFYELEPRKQRQYLRFKTIIYMFKYYFNDNNIRII